MTELEIPPPVTDRPHRIRDGLRDARELFVCLDFDGTLAPIVEDPEAARMTDANRNGLATLANETAVTVAVVSGRALADVRDRVDHPEILAGNHGLELARNGTEAVHPIAEKRSRTLEHVCGVLEERFDPIPNCRVESKILTGTVHVGSVPDSAREHVRRVTRSVVDRIGGDELACSTGKCVIEIGPALAWGKGDAVELVEADLPAETFTLYVGDDVTDEDAFGTVEPEGVGVLVGSSRPSRASCRVDTPADVAVLLRWLASAGVDCLDT